MNKKLPADFHLTKYGLDVCLVKEDDAEFILELRTDPKLGQFLHATDNSVDNQKTWIKEYKKREDQGLDYYFIYKKDDSPIGVNRIYGIDTKNKVATGGSWICKFGLPVELSILTLIIMRDIMFDEFDLEYDRFDVRKLNKKVQKTHLIFGAKEIGEDDLNYYYELYRTDYFLNRQEIIKMLNIK